MSGFTGNYYWGVPNVNRSRIPVRTLGTIQEGGQPGGFNMYNTSTITQIPTNTQTTTPVVPTNTQTTTTQVINPPASNTQTTTPLISTTTQTTTPQIPVSNVTTLPNILHTTTTPVGTMTGATQGGSSTGNPGNSTGGFNFFNNLYGNTPGGFGYNSSQSQGFGFTNTQNLPPGFGGGNPGGNPGGPPGGGDNINPRGLDPNVAALVNALTGMNIGGGYVP